MGAAMESTSSSPARTTTTPHSSVAESSSDSTRRHENALASIGSFSTMSSFTNEPTSVY